MPRTPDADRDDKLYNALLALGDGWHARNALATQLGKRRLNGDDSKTLARLVDAGRIETRRETIPGPIPLRWEYRAVRGGDQRK